MNRLLLSLAAVLLSVGSCLAAGKKPTYLISFHEEGDSFEGKRKIQSMEINGETRHFRVNPVLTQANIKAYWAFPAADGRSWGAVFWLDAGGHHTLQRIGVANRGQFLAAAVNRIPVDVLLIDDVPPDFRIVVWKGLPLELFRAIDKEKKIRRMGEAPSAGALAARAARAPAAAPTPVRAPGAPLPARAGGAPFPENAVLTGADPLAFDPGPGDLPKAKPTKKSFFSRKKDPLPPPPAPELPFPPFDPGALPEAAEISQLPELETRKP